MSSDDVSNITGAQPHILCFDSAPAARRSPSYRSLSPTHVAGEEHKGCKADYPFACTTPMNTVLSPPKTPLAPAKKHKRTREDHSDVVAAFYWRQQRQRYESHSPAASCVDQEGSVDSQQASCGGDAGEEADAGAAFAHTNDSDLGSPASAVSKTALTSVTPVEVVEWGVVNTPSVVNAGGGDDRDAGVAQLRLVLRVPTLFTTAAGKPVCIRDTRTIPFGVRYSNFLFSQASSEADALRLNP